MRSRTRSYWQVVRDSSAITQQVDTVALVAAVSVYLYKASSFVCRSYALFCMHGAPLLMHLYCPTIAALFDAAVLLIASTNTSHC